MAPLSRRRFIRISAAMAGFSLVTPYSRARAAPPELVSWHGVALGAVASMQIHHSVPEVAQRLVTRVVAEVDRLESIFSLYRTDSSLTELNRRGVLVAPPAELVELLAACQQYWALTGGKFDPTVQPLWNLYSAHYAQDSSRPPPASEILAETRERVGWSRVTFNRDVVVLGGRGMAITLNGIAQGYITDRIVALLADSGICQALVDMGEIRALGERPDGQSWKVALDFPPGRAARRVIALADRAIATSAADGFAFDVSGGSNHLFDPATGRCADPRRSVTVHAPTATCADALSTAFDLMEASQIREILGKMTGVEAYFDSASASGHSDGNWH